QLLLQRPRLIGLLPRLALWPTRIPWLPRWELTLAIVPRSVQPLGLESSGPLVTVELRCLWLLRRASGSSSRTVLVRFARFTSSGTSKVMGAVLTGAAL